MGNITLQPPVPIIPPTKPATSPTITSRTPLKGFIDGKPFFAPTPDMIGQNVNPVMISKRKIIGA
jgi:hypothetical protein